MNRTKTILLLIAAAAVLALVLALPFLEAAITAQLPLKDLKALVIERAREKGIDLSIKGVRFELLHGVVFTGVSARVGEQQPFFHAQNLIMPMSPLEAMKKTMSLRLRIVGGRLFHDNISRKQAQDIVKSLEQEGDWKISFENLALDFRPSRFAISGSIAPDGNTARGKVELTLDGRQAASGDVIAGNGKISVRFKLKDMPFEKAADLLPGLSSGQGLVSGKGSVTIDDLALAYDVKGEIKNFTTELTPEPAAASFVLNGGYGWKEQMRITSQLTLERPDAKLEMKERLREAGRAVREVNAAFARIPGTEAGTAELYWRSSFRDARFEQIEDVKLTVLNLKYVPAKGTEITAERIEMTANQELKITAAGTIAGHALSLSLSGPIRFGDRPENFAGGPLRLEGKMDRLDPARAAAAIFAVHSALVSKGEEQDAEKAEDTGPLWEQRKRGPVALSLLSSFQVNGEIAVPGIQGLTDEPVRIMAQKTGASLSTQIIFETAEKHLKADYSLTFDADLPHQTIHIKYMNPANQVPVDYLLGPGTPQSLFVDFTSSMDGFLPADLVYKSSSNLFLKAGPVAPAVEPAKLLLSLAGLDQSRVLEELEIQRVTEGGRTIWSKVSAKRGDETVTGSGEFGSDGGKAAFYVAAAMKSTRIDLGITEAGKWYPREN